MKIKLYGTSKRMFARLQAKNWTTMYVEIKHGALQLVLVNGNGNKTVFSAYNEGKLDLEHKPFDRDLVSHMIEFQREYHEFKAAEAERMVKLKDVLGIVEDMTGNDCCYHVLNELKEKLL